MTKDIKRITEARVVFSDGSADVNLYTPGQADQIVRLAISGSGPHPRVQTREVTTLTERIVGDWEEAFEPRHFKDDAGDWAVEAKPGFFTWVEVGGVRVGAYGQWSVTEHYLQDAATDDATPSFLKDADGDWWVQDVNQCFHFLGTGGRADRWLECLEGHEGEAARTLVEIREIYGIDAEQTPWPPVTNREVYHLFDRWGDVWISGDCDHWWLENSTDEPWTLDRVGHLFGIDARRVTA